MKNPRKFFSTSTWLLILYGLATVIYLVWATIPIRAHPQLAETIPGITRTPRATRTPTLSVTPTMTNTPTTTVSATPTSTPLVTESETSQPAATATETATDLSATGTASATPTPTAMITEIATPTLATVALAITKTDFLFSDEDRNNLVSPGDKLLYAITLSNTGEVSAQQLQLEDTLDPNTTLIGGTLKTNKGTVRQGNTADDAQVIIDIGTFAPGERATISLQVSLKAQVNDTQVQNQAVVTFANGTNGVSGQTTVISDDPDTAQTLDSTITPLNGNQPRPASKLFLPLVAHK